MRDTRVTGEEAQGTKERRKMRGEATFRPFSPSRLPLRASRERETSAYEAGVKKYAERNIGTLIIARLVDLSQQF